MGRPRLLNHAQRSADGKYIIITARNGGEIFVDVDDYPLVKEFTWDIDGGYPRAYVNGKMRRMHRVILGDQPKGLVADHISGNALDCRRCNMRVVSISDNHQNLRATKGCTFHRLRGTWMTRIKSYGKMIYVGYFDTVAEAVLARNAYIEKHNLNNRKIVHVGNCG